MCIQDLKLVQGGTIVSYVHSPTGFGFHQLQIVGRPLWVRATENGTGGMTILRRPSNTSEFDLPFDSDFRLPGDGVGYVTRYQVGSVLDGPLYVAESFGVDIYVQYLRLDSEVDRAIHSPLLE